jgi:hypothetical protein
MWLDMGGDYSKMLEVAAEMPPADISAAERRGIACRKSKYQAAIDCARCRRILMSVASLKKVSD